MINKETIKIDYNDLLNNEQFREYLNSNFGKPTLMESILDAGIPYGKMSMIMGQSKVGSIIDKYIDYLKFLKIENRHSKINDILDEKLES